MTRFAQVVHLCLSVHSSPIQARRTASSRTGGLAIEAEAAATVAQASAVELDQPANGA